MQEKTKDRHKAGCFAEYAKRTGKKDRHRKGYYKAYNQAHPERLERIGICARVVRSKGGSRIVRGKDGRLYTEVITREIRKMDIIDAKISNKENTWYDDDWQEDCGE